MIDKYTLDISPFACFFCCLLLHLSVPLFVNILCTWKKKQQWPQYSHASQCYCTTYTDYFSSHLWTLVCQIIPKWTDHCPVLRFLPWTDCQSSWNLSANALKCIMVYYLCRLHFEANHRHGQILNLDNKQWSHFCFLQLEQLSDAWLLFSFFLFYGKASN